MDLGELSHSLLILYTIRWLGTVLNWTLVLLLLYMRFKGEKTPMTLSQRWALTLLLWLFLLNSLTLVREHLSDYFFDIGDITALFYLNRINMSLDVMIGMTLLMFGMVFPRPFFKWEKLQRAILVIMAVMIVMVFIQMAGNRSETDLRIYTFMSGWAYPLGWFIPVIIWLSHYEKEPSPQSRMVLSLFIWGFLIAPFPGSMAGWMLRITGYEGLYAMTGASLMALALFLYVCARLFMILWRTRDAWTNAEWIHLWFIGVIIPLAITMTVNTYLMDTTVIQITDAIGKNISWTTIRPALFIVAILKFQIFGTQIKVDKHLSYIIATATFFFVVILVETLSAGLDIYPSLSVSIIVGLVLSYPAFRWSRRVIERILPMTSDEERATMLEKRATYLVSLQTAVVGGRIDTEHDAQALSQQRRALGITVREHELLMDSFLARETTLKTAPQIKELFLIHYDGRPLVHERTSLDAEDDSDVGKDKDIMAGMLVAIQGYVEEGLKGGSKGRNSLDTVKYGDYSLIIETEEYLVLAVVVKGTDNPELRQGMRDNLTILRRKYGAILERWDGDLDKTAGPEKDLRSFLAEMSLKWKDTSELGTR